MYGPGKVGEPSQAASLFPSAILRAVIPISPDLFAFPSSKQNTGRDTWVAETASHKGTGALAAFVGKVPSRKLPCPRTSEGFKGLLSHPLVLPTCSCGSLDGKMRV